MDDETLRQIAVSLGMEPARVATDEQLEQIKQAVGAALPPLFERFLRVYGKPIGYWLVGSGPMEGGQLMFFDVGEILSRLEELAGEAIVPFADDVSGSVYCLISTGEVVQFDHNQECFLKVAPSFETLLRELKRPMG